MITTLEEAFAALADAESDVRADMGDEAVDAGYYDIVEAVCWEISDTAVARELCRRTLGYIPHGQESRLGRGDWLL